MNVDRSQWMEPKRLSIAFLGTLIGFACLSILALGVSRLEHLFPSERLFSTTAFGQIFGLHAILLNYFVLIPALPVVAAVRLLPTRLGLEELSFPRLLKASFILFLLGGGLVIASTLSGGIEPGWMYVTDRMAGGHLLSPAFLIGMMFTCAAIQLLGVNLVATILPRRQKGLDLFTHSVFWSGCLLMLAMPILLCGLALAFLNSHTSLALFSPALGGDPTLLVTMTALASTPIHTAVLLPILGLACDLVKMESHLSPGTVRIVKGAFLVLALLGLVAVDPQAMPDVLAPQYRMALSFNKLLLIVPLCIILMNAFRAGVRPANLGGIPGLYVLGALLFLGLRIPLSLLLLMPSAGLYTQSYLTIAEGSLLVTGALFMVLLALSYQTVLLRQQKASFDRSALLIAIIILAGMMATTLPMLVAGSSGLPAFMAVFPAQNLFFQMLIFAGSGILLVGFLCALGHVVRAQRQAVQYGRARAV